MFALNLWFSQVGKHSETVPFGGVQSGIWRENKTKGWHLPGPRILLADKGLGWDSLLNVYIPRTQLTSIVEGQQPQSKAEIPSKTRVISVLGCSRYIYIYIRIIILVVDYCILGMGITLALNISKVPMDPSWLNGDPTATGATPTAADLHRSAKLSIAFQFVCILTVRLRDFSRKTVDVFFSLPKPRWVF